MLKRLQIRNFRGFNALEIDQLSFDRYAKSRRNFLRIIAATAP